jgi:alpha-beta hydrolase superfamily lysophospholipase
MQSQEITFKTQDGMKLVGTQWLPENTPKASVVLIHGLGEHVGRYEHVAQAFTAAGFILRGFDLRGHGRSEGTRGHFDSYDQVALDIDQFIIDTRAGQPTLPVFLYGHSLGGALVLYYGETHQGSVNGIIATSPGLAPATPLSAPRMTAARVFSFVAPRLQLKNDLDLTGLSHDPQIMEKYTADPLVHPLVSARLGLQLIQNGRFIIDHANQLAVPLLLLQGSADRLVNPSKTEEFARKVPANLLTYHTYPEGFHELHNEPGKAEIIQTMIDWMDQHLD